MFRFKINNNITIIIENVYFLSYTGVIMSETPKPTNRDKLPRNARRGKRKNSTNKATKERLRAAKKVAESGETPLEYMVGIMRSPIPPEIKYALDEQSISVELLSALTDWHKMRFEAAKAAAPFVHPKLAAVTHSGDKDKPISFSDSDKLEAAKRIALALKIKGT